MIYFHTWRVSAINYLRKATGNWYTRGVQHGWYLISLCVRSRRLHVYTRVRTKINAVFAKALIQTRDLHNTFVRWRCFYNSQNPYKLAKSICFWMNFNACEIYIQNRIFVTICIDEKNFCFIPFRKNLRLL